VITYIIIPDEIREFFFTLVTAEWCPILLIDLTRNTTPESFPISSKVMELIISGSTFANKGTNKWISPFSHFLNNRIFFEMGCWTWAWIIGCLYSLPLALSADHCYIKGGFFIWYNWRSTAHQLYINHSSTRVQPDFTFFVFVPLFIASFTYQSAEDNISNLFALVPFLLSNKYEKKVWLMRVYFLKHSLNPTSTRVQPDFKPIISIHK
jgi:hypothetical protein